MLSYFIWIDKKLVLMILIVDCLVVGNGHTCQEYCFRKDRIVKIDKTPIHHQYQTYMCSVDAFDQLKSNDTTMVRTHNLWHKMLFFLVDESILNA